MRTLQADSGPCVRGQAGARAPRTAARQAGGPRVGVSARTGGALVWSDAIESASGGKFGVGGVWTDAIKQVFELDR